MNETYDYVILGGGLAGLAFAENISKKGFTVIVIEQDSKVGGLSKTLNYKGFLFDYCAHRFHSANPNVMNYVKEIMGANFIKTRQISRIFMFGKFLKYPFQLQNLLRAMPIHQALLSSVSFAYSFIKRHIFIKEGQFFKNYKDWFIHFFGQQLYKVMCEPYTTKIWKHRPEHLSADWADQRFQGINIKQLIYKIIYKIIRFDFSSYDLKDEALAPDGGEFWYPKNGIQDLPDRYAELILINGGRIITHAKVNKISTPNKSVSYIKSQKNHCVNYTKAVVSTIPINDLYYSLDYKNPIVENALSSLKYMSIIFVYLLIDEDNVSPDHWLYFPNSSILFNRSVEFKNWSASMAPAGKTALCLDITCFENDTTWLMDKDLLVKKCSDNVESVGLVKKEKIYGSLVIKVKNAYPFYDLEYKDKVKTVVNFCEKSGDIYCLGRTGIFQYNNSDGSIEMALVLADKIGSKNYKSNEHFSLLEYKFKNISY